MNRPISFGCNVGAWLKKPAVFFCLVLGALYVGAIAFNVTTSSLALNFSSSTEENSANEILGKPRPIRSDEWLRSTPYQIGRLHDSWNIDFNSPFEFRDESLSTTSSRIVSTAIFPERRIFEKMGSRGFAAVWWFPIFMSAVSLFALFRLNQRSPKQALFAVVIVAFSSTVAWWSYSPLEVIWPCVFGLVLIQFVAQQDHLSKFWQNQMWSERFISMLLPIIGGVALSRIPFVYQPWSLTTFLIVAALGFDLLRQQGLLRKAIRPVLFSGFTALTIAGIWYVMIRGQYSTLAQTIYPGGRRSNGGGLVVPLFSGPLDFALGNSTGVIQGTNQSEGALGWLVLTVVAVLVWVISVASTSIDSRKSVAQRWISTSILGLVLIGWGTFSWPTVLLHFNPLRFIPGDRLIQIGGVVWLIPAILILTSELKELDQKRRRFVAVSLALLVFFFTLNAGISFRANVPNLSVEAIWMAGTAMSVGVLCLIMWPRRYLGLVPLAAFAVWSTCSVNPLVSGFGDLTNSPAASTISASVRANTPMFRVGSDDIYVDALIAANGLPLLGGQQGWGPNRDAYSAIDPALVFEDQWNQGASYLRFSWDESFGDDLVVNSSGDQIVVSISPCNQGLKTLGMGWIISTRPLTAPCLLEKSMIKWTDLDRWLYQVT